MHRDFLRGLGPADARYGAVRKGANLLQQQDARQSRERQTKPNKRNRVNEEAACLDDKSHRKQLGGLSKFSGETADDRKLQEAQNIFMLKMFASEILCFHPAAHHGEETERFTGNTINTYLPRSWSVPSWSCSQSDH